MGDFVDIYGSESDGLDPSFLQEIDRMINQISESLPKSYVQCRKWLSDNRLMCFESAMFMISLVECIGTIAVAIEAKHADLADSILIDETGRIFDHLGGFYDPYIRFSCGRYCSYKRTLMLKH